MDNFPDISAPAVPDDEVECYVDKDFQYEGSNLAIFPLQNGYEWKKGLDNYADEYYVLQTSGRYSHTSSQRSKQSFIQAWLFFGCLIDTFAIIGIELQFEAFVYERNGLRFLTLKGLEKYVTHWEVFERRTDSEARSRHKSSIDECLELAERFALENLQRHQSYRKMWSLSPGCSLLIQLLHEGLRYAWSTIYQPENLAIFSGYGLLSDIPEERMRTAAWCPSEISMVQNRFFVTGRYFASRLRRNRMPMDHRKCSENKCYASQIDNSTYVTKHTSEICACEHVRIDENKLATILRAGMIPRFLIQARAGSEDDIEIQILDSGSYVAISHVWAYGLGNVRANSLPSCQLRRLRDYTLALDKDTQIDPKGSPLAIWIDTLGVPLERETRKLALKTLGETYSDSNCCLVLDEELYLSSVQSSLEERCVRLVLSTWSRRLWTFQEGLITWDKLYIQYREGPQRFFALRTESRSFPHSLLRSQCIEEAQRSLPRLHDVQAADRNIIGALTEACKYRTTSRLSDETFCLASVAGLDLQPIVQADTHEEKMKLFWLQIREIPRQIIFYTGPRLRSHGFEWAPASFLYPEPSSSIFSNEGAEVIKAQCHPSGLQAQWPGFILSFSSSARAPMDVYYFRFRCFWVVIQCIAMMEQQLHNVEPDEEQIQIWRQFHDIPHIGLLINSFDSMQDMGLIVAIKKKGPKQIVAQHVLRVNAILVPFDEPGIFNPMKVDPTRGVQIDGDLMDQDTLWTIQ